MSAPVRMVPVPLRPASGSGACCTVSESAPTCVGVCLILVLVNRLQKEHPA